MILLPKATSMNFGGWCLRFRWVEISPSLDSSLAGSPFGEEAKKSLSFRCDLVRRVMKDERAFSTGFVILSESGSTKFLCSAFIV